MAHTVTFKGGPVNLAGNALKPGDSAPDFKAIIGFPNVAGLSATGAKARLFSIVPSLDTGVCSMQTKKFNDGLKALGDSVEAYTVSLDLPFAQGRFCSAEGISNMKTISDVHDHSFGKNWGVLIESGLPLKLLARAVFVVDKNGKITYAQYVPEVTSEPNYDAALNALKAAAK
jgi:thiol peroxidase